MVSTDIGGTLSNRESEGTDIQGALFKRKV